MKKNLALQYFKGEAGEDKDNKFEYDKWYGAETLEHVSFVYQTTPILRHIFVSDKDETNFVEQFIRIKQLLPLLNQENMAFVYGAGRGHFIFGIILKDDLLIIDPMGKTVDIALFAKLKLALTKQGLSGLQNIYISKTKLQSDTSSCGPIALELLMHISSLNASDIKNALLTLEAKEHNNLNYFLAELAPSLLPSSLQELMVQKFDTSIKGKVKEIRKKHAELLTTTSAKLEKLNHVLTEGLQLPMKQVITDLLTKTKDLASIQEEPCFKQVIQDYGNYRNEDLGYSYSSDEQLDLQQAIHESLQPQIENNNLPPDIRQHIPDFLEHIRQGNQEEIQKFMAKMPEIVNCIDEISNKTALAIAIEQGHTTIVKLLTNQISSTNSLDKLSYNEIEVTQHNTVDSTESKSYTDIGYLLALELGRKFKNLQEGFTWEDIPMLAVITGKNGIGKTRLLESILMGFAGNYNVPIRLYSGQHKALPQISSYSSSDDLVKVDFEKGYKASIEDRLKDLVNYDMSMRFDGEYELQFPEYKEIYQTVIERHKKNKPSIKGNNNFPHAFYEGLKQCFTEYMGAHVSIYASLEKYPKYLLETATTLDELNDYLNKKDFKYIIDEQSYGNTYDSRGNKLFDRLMLRNKNSREQVDYGWLSPGEKLELLTLLWLFDKSNIKKNDQGTILILDEPDAHLHPSLAKEIIEAIKNKLVGEYGIQIIMTTHNPSTVSLVPKDSLFIMSKDDQSSKISIDKALSKRQAIQLLTSDFVCVNQPFRIIFVEASNDVKFYQGIYEKLINQRLLNPEFQLLFKSYGKPKESNKAKKSDKTKAKDVEHDSSRSLVEGFVERCVGSNEEDTSLKDFIFGIVDNDNRGDSAILNVIAIQRYAIENYVYDPINIFFDSKKHNISWFKQLSQAIESKIGNEAINLINSSASIFKHPNKKLVQDLLQFIVDSISTIFISQLQSKIDVKAKIYSYKKQDIIETLNKDRFKLIDPNNKLISTKIKVVYGDIELDYPELIIKMKGHHLEDFWLKYISEGAKLNINRLLNCYKENMAISNDLVDVFKLLELPASHYQPKVQHDRKSAKNKAGKDDDIEKLNQDIINHKKMLKDREEKLKNKNKKIDELDGRINKFKNNLAKTEEDLSKTTQILAKKGIFLVNGGKTYKKAFEYEDKDNILMLNPFEKKPM